jgi:hypothetical protein
MLGRRDKQTNLTDPVYHNRKALREALDTLIERFTRERDHHDQTLAAGERRCSALEEQVRAAKQALEEKKEAAYHRAREFGIEAEMLADDDFAVSIAKTHLEERESALKRAHDHVEDARKRRDETTKLITAAKSFHDEGDVLPDVLHPYQLDLIPKWTTILVRDGREHDRQLNLIQEEVIESAFEWNTDAEPLKVNLDSLTRRRKVVRAYEEAVNQYIQNATELRNTRLMLAVTQTLNELQRTYERTYNLCTFKLNAIATGKLSRSNLTAARAAVVIALAGLLFSVALYSCDNQGSVGSTSTETAIESESLSTQP